MNPVPIDTLVNLFALLFYCQSPADCDILQPQSSIDQLIQSEQYETALETIDGQESRDEINPYTARMYDFKVLYNLQDEAQLDRFADEVVRTETKTAELLMYLYGLKDQGREKSTDKVYHRINQLLREQPLLSDRDSCGHFYMSVYARSIYHNHYMLEPVYSAPTDSIPYYCKDETTQEVINTYFSDPVFTVHFSLALSEFLSSDFLWSEVYSESQD